MRSKILLLSLCLLCLSSIQVYAVNDDSGTGVEDKETAAVEAARSWLRLVDEGKYEESFSTAAEYFKNAITENQWLQALTATRKPLGKVLSRELKSKKYMTELPGAPDGEYVLIQFNTSYENKKFAVETVTPMLEQDGTWKISGYYIK